MAEIAGQIADPQGSTTWQRPVRETTREVNAGHRRKMELRQIVYSAPAGHTIPPEDRLIAAGCSEHCRTCDRWTRSGGGCPGAPRGEGRKPICHSDDRAFWDEILAAATGPRRDEIDAVSRTTTTDAQALAADLG